MSYGFKPTQIHFIIYSGAVIYGKKKKKLKFCKFVLSIFNLFSIYLTLELNWKKTLIRLIEIKEILFIYIRKYILKKKKFHSTPQFDLLFKVEIRIIYFLYIKRQVFVFQLIF